MNNVNCNPKSKHRQAPLIDFFSDVLTSPIADIIRSEFVGNKPAVNIIENSDKFSLEVAVPGHEKDAITIKTEKQRLIISASTESDPELRKYRRREFDYSNFERSFKIPNSVDSDSIEATYHAGILTLTLPKKTEAKPVSRKIDIA